VEASVTLKNVSKHYQRKYALSGLTLGIEKGSVFAVIGRSGAGKSVLMRLLSTLGIPDKGAIYIQGKSTSEYRQETATLVGYLPEHDMHDPWKSGWENLDHRADLLGLDRTHVKEVLDPWIREFDMQAELPKCPVSYSKGKKRCLDLLQVLMSDSPILILDEPTQALDHASRNALFRYLLRVRGEKTIIVASNRFTEMQALADRWVVLHRGQIRFDGTREQMIEQMEIPFVGEVELSEVDEELLAMLRRSHHLQEIKTYGKLLKFSVQGYREFQTIIAKLDPGKVISIRGDSACMDDFLNQLLIDEGY